MLNVFTDVNLCLFVVIVQDNATSKTHIGHYTFYHKTVIRRPELCYLAEDIYCEDYIGGEGTKVYANVGDVKDDIENNLNGSSDRKGDIVVIAIEPGVPVTNPIDIKGSFQSEIHGANHTCFEAAENEDESAIYKALKDNVQRPQNVDEDTAFNTPFERHNTICFRGAYCLPEYDESKRFGGLLNPNTGFWGPDCYAGCREARTGNMTCLKKTEACNGSFFNCPPPKGGYPKEKQSGGGGGGVVPPPPKKVPYKGYTLADFLTALDTGAVDLKKFEASDASVIAPRKGQQNPFTLALFDDQIILDITNDIDQFYRRSEAIMSEEGKAVYAKIKRIMAKSMEPKGKVPVDGLPVMGEGLTSAASSSVVNLMDAEPSAARRTSRGSGKAKLKK